MPEEAAILDRASRFLLANCGEKRLEKLRSFLLSDEASVEMGCNVGGMERLINYFQILRARIHLDHEAKDSKKKPGYRRMKYARRQPAMSLILRKIHPLTPEFQRDLQEAHRKILQELPPPPCA